MTSLPFVNLGQIISYKIFQFYSETAPGFICVGLEKPVANKWADKWYVILDVIAWPRRR